MLWVRCALLVHAPLLKSWHCVLWLPQVMLERACKAAAERADNDFRALLLAQQQEGAISARSTWSAVKAQVNCLVCCWLSVLNSHSGQMLWGNWVAYPRMLSMLMSGS